MDAESRGGAAGRSGNLAGECRPDDAAHLLEQPGREHRQRPSLRGSASARPLGAVEDGQLGHKGDTDFGKRGTLRNIKKQRDPGSTSLSLEAGGTSTFGVKYQSQPRRSAK